MKSMPFIALMAFAFLAACQPTVANRGNLVEDSSLAELKVGESDQAAVQSTLGPPTATGTFENNVWYYSGMRTKKTAFFDPKVSYVRTLVVKFDDNGVLQSIDEVDPKMAENISPSGGTTKTGGRDLTFMEQLIDNFSRPTLPGSITDKRGPGQARRPGGL